MSDKMSDISAALTATEKVPCPFVYATGRKCTGHVIRIEAFKADLEWKLNDDGTWSFEFGEPRSHYHLYCSEKNNHAGYDRPDSEKMSFYYDKLPASLQSVIARSHKPTR